MFNLEGLPPAPRGMPQIEVKFDIDANGILNVSAKDLGTGKEQTVRIEQSSGISEDEIEKMRKDADSHAEEDKRKRALAEQRNQADSMCWQLEKLIKEHDAKLNRGRQGGREQGHREDPRGGQERRPRPDQGGGARVGAGLARPEQDALREGGRQAAGAAPARPGRSRPGASPRPRAAAAMTTPSTPSSR